MENKDAMEHLEIKENKELTTSVHWIPVHQKGHLVNLVMMVQTGLWDKLEIKEKQEKQERWDCLVMMEILDVLENQDRTENREWTDSVVCQEWMQESIVNQRAVA